MFLIITFIYHSQKFSEVFKNSMNEKLGTITIRRNFFEIRRIIFTGDVYSQKFL